MSQLDRWVFPKGLRAWFGFPRVVTSQISKDWSEKFLGLISKNKSFSGKL